MKMRSFANEQFFRSWNKVFVGGLDPLNAYKAKKIGDFLAVEYKRFNEIRSSIAEKYGEKDEKGNFLLKNGGLVIKEENQASADKEIEQLQEIELGNPPLLLDYLELSKCPKLELSGLDVSILEDLLDFKNVK